jgi:NADH-quinone oxidoreductase subunit E
MRTAGAWSPVLARTPGRLPDDTDMKFAVPTHLEAEIDELVTHYPHRRSATVMVLHVLQDHFGCLSKGAMEWTAAKLGLQPINVYELATFYPMFRQQPIGKFHLKVCRTLSCALAGSDQLHERLCEKLGLDPRAHGPQTTPDGKFTVEFVECLASCGTAPAMMCNDILHEEVTEAKVDELLSQCG